MVPCSVSLSTPSRASSTARCCCQQRTRRGWRQDGRSRTAPAKNFVGDKFPTHCAAARCRATAGCVSSPRIFTVLMPGLRHLVRCTSVRLQQVTKYQYALQRTAPVAARTLKVSCQRLRFTLFPRLPAGLPRFPVVFCTRSTGSFRYLAELPDTRSSLPGAVLMPLPLRRIHTPACHAVPFDAPRHPSVHLFCAA